MEEDRGGGDDNETQPATRSSDRTCPKKAPGFRLPLLPPAAAAAGAAQFASLAVSVTNYGRGGGRQIVVVAHAAKPTRVGLGFGGSLSQSAVFSHKKERNGGEEERGGNVMTTGGCIGHIFRRKRRVEGLS